MRGDYRPVVYTGGTFDLFHVGHVELLREAQKLAGPAGRVVVGLNSDEFVAGFKGRPPVMRYDERAACLEACRWVDQVVLNVGGPDSRPTVDMVGPQYIAVGSDWYDGPAPDLPGDGADPWARYCQQMCFDHEWLAERGIQLRVIPRTTGVSTTLLRERLRSA